MAAPTTKASEPQGTKNLQEEIQNKIDTLYIEQTTNIRAVMRAVTFVRAIQPEHRIIPILQSREELLQQYWLECSAADKEIQKLAGHVDQSKRSYFAANKFEQVELEYLNAKDQLAIWQHAARDATARASQPGHLRHQGQATDSNVKLPKITVPNFSGKFTEWAAFKDSFVALVKSNQNLKDIEKLHYLKASVNGEANDLVCNIQLIDGNFQTAWDLLENRFSNKRATTNAHLAEIFKLESLKSESASNLLNFRNVITRNLAALRNLGCPTEHYSAILIYVLADKLDKKTQRDWEISIASTADTPSFHVFDNFLIERIRVLESLHHVEAPLKASQAESRSVNNNSKAPSKSNRSKASSVDSHVTSQSKSQCQICDQEHKIYTCPKFNSLTINERYENIKSRQLCSNCLGKGHKHTDCSSKYTCRQCGQKHHTMLHRNAAQPPASSKSPADPKTSDQSTSDQVAAHMSMSKKPHSVPVWLATIKVWISSNTNRKIQVRALLDQGSTRSFVSSKVAAALDAQRIKISATMSGLGGVPTGSTSSAVNLNLLNQNGAIALQTQALVLPKITSYTSSQRVLTHHWPHLNNLALSDDPSSNEEIQLLIGADLYGSIILDEIKKGKIGEPIAQNTIFGWVVSGPTNRNCESNSSIISVHQSTVFSELNSSIKNFWEVENVPTKPVLSPDDEWCEAHFANIHSRDKDGRYIVRIPFKANMRPDIGQSRFIAERMFKRTEASLSKNLTHQRMYSDFMTEYEELNHISRVAPANPQCTSVAYLPHHPVIREQSLTTKLRVVFNASSKTSNGTSINDHMLTGHKLQSELFVVIAQWRSYPLVFSADIAKMYRQIYLHPLDRDYQRILWRSSPDSPLEEYQLNTVTYGTRPAAFLAIRAVKQLILDEGQNFSLAAPVLDLDTIVDDILFGAYSQTSALRVRHELIELLKKAQLEPRKWASNDPELVADIDPTNHGLAWNSLSPNDRGIKVLGIQWNPNSDNFHFAINLVVPPTLTKRKALSILSMLFDPLGWVAPVVLKGKTMMQKLWLHAMQWDEPLPAPLSVQWSNYFSSLAELSEITIPRWNGLHIANLDNQLHGFADASNDAYGAVVYLRTVTPQGETMISLIMSKTKVAPLKNAKIHRLELQAAVLLAQLISALREVRALKDLPVQCWTDSSITLSWLRKHASNWKLFVSNRVAEVHELLPNHSWRHVPTQSNPADLASRGCQVTDLVASSLWWHGPDWLALPASQWPDTFPAPVDEQDLEMKPNVNHVAASSTHPLQALATKFSSWIKALRVTAYLLRYIHNLRCKIKAARAAPADSRIPRVCDLTAHELSASALTLFRYLQSQMYPEELKELAKAPCVTQKSRILSLNPILDPNSGVIRVGGRLGQSDLPYAAKHPVILGAHPLVSALIRYTHVQCLHGGTKLTLSTLRQTIWLTNPRPQIKAVIFKCVPCTRMRAKMMSQVMADLPKSRVTAVERAFFNCGVDYAGPLQVRQVSGRGHKAHPCYIAVFVCFSVKAIHLELVSDYSSPAFIAAYKRFVARRGLPAHMYSDRGTTFQGAERLLQEEFAQATADSDFQSLLARDNVTWHFNPPAAPHFGGLWESGVKSMKTHLKRILINHTPTYEELTTILCQIESVLNSRPLEPLNDHADDLSCLTPGHFLVGGPLNAVPQAALSHLKVNRLSRWQLQQQMFETFWRRWSHDYLQSLQSRTKWRLPTIQIKPGHMVLLKSPTMPPAKWHLARVVDCHLGQDGHVRVVKIKTATSEYLRPISELVLLPIDLDDQKIDAPAPMQARKLAATG